MVLINVINQVLTCCWSTWSIRC